METDNSLNDILWVFHVTFWLLSSTATGLSILALFYIKHKQKCRDLVSYQYILHSMQCAKIMLNNNLFNTCFPYENQTLKSEIPY